MPVAINHAHVVRNALSRFRPGVVAREDMEAEAWLAVLQAAPRYDPARHHCTQGAFLVVKARAHLSRVIRKARRQRAEQLPAQVVARDHTPLDEACFNERMAREKVNI